MRHFGWIAAVALLGAAGTAQAKAPAAAAQAAPAPAAGATTKPAAALKRVKRAGTPTAGAQTFLPAATGVYSAIFAASTTGLFTRSSASPE